MAFYAKTHAMTYRPLIGGIGVTAPQVQSAGTLGIIAYDDSGPWIVSNYHVLCRADLSPFQEGEPVYQCFIQPGDTPVARLVKGKAFPDLDCAAARAEPGIDTMPWILELGSIIEYKQPLEGRRVIKSGLATGVTEGIIRDITGDVVRIEAPDNYPARYDLSNIGDSGSVWVDVEWRAAVVLHNRTQDGQSEAAFGYAMPAVMNALQLKLK